MQSAKKKINHNTDSGGSSGQQQEHLGKQKERHIVSWSQEEDDILREQINIHGTESWSTIAARFKDKTTRQCRRRWYTYLNSDFKKGGWSPEEDLLLCEAQKVFGNRWTEIAKVVSGRTDNAVKNRFSTLCKKRAKREALAKENNTSFINLNNKRVIFPTSQNADGLSEGGEHLKKIRRTHLPSTTENRKHIVGERGSSTQTLRQPFAVVAQDKKNGGSLSNEKCVNNIKEVPVDAGTSKNKETFIKKDDPKVLALLQQAELLSSLAAKVNSDNTEQSLENAWKDLQDFLHQSKESDELCLSVSDMDYHLETIKDLIEDLQGSDGCSLSSWRQPDLYEETTSGSPQYSTGSTPQNLVACDKADQSHPELHVPILSVEPEIQSIPVDNPGIIEGENHMPVVEPPSAQEKTPPVDDDLKANNLAACSSSNAEFNSPIQETPVFKSLAAAIPSPKFSESERNFLLKALGRDSASCFINPSAHLSQPPACKRALLRSL